MRIYVLKCLRVLAAAGIVIVCGCTESTPPAGPAEKAGAAIDNAAEKTVEKTGAVLEKAGDAVEKTGADMQK